MIMRKFTYLINASLDGVEITENKLEMAIQLAAVIQGIRVRWGPEFQYWVIPEDPTEKIFHITELPEFRAVVKGTVFPSNELMELMLRVFDEGEEFPIPKTEEVYAYYSYLSGEFSIFENPMVEILKSSKSNPALIKELRRIYKIPANKPDLIKYEMKRLLKRYLSGYFSKVA